MDDHDEVGQESIEHDASPSTVPPLSSAAGEKVRSGPRERGRSVFDLEVNRHPTVQGFALSPLLKLLNRVTVVNPGAGCTVFSSGPNSVVELPPNVFVVPGMKPPPCCHTHDPWLAPVVKNGQNAAPLGG